MLTSWIRAAVIASATAFFAASPAAASFMGSTIRAQWLFPDINTTYSSSIDAVVGAGVEFPTGTPSIGGDTYDFGATTLFVSQVFGEFNPTSFSGVRFTDLDGTIADIVGVTIDGPGTAYPGFDASRISFDANNIWINFQSLETGHALLNVTFATVDAPEPASLALLGVGLTGLALSRRRRA